MHQNLRRSLVAALIAAGLIGVGVVTLNLVQDGDADAPPSLPDAQDLEAANAKFKKLGSALSAHQKELEALLPPENSKLTVNIYPRIGMNSFSTSFKITPSGSGKGNLLVFTTFSTEDAAKAGLDYQRGRDGLEDVTDIEAGGTTGLRFRVPVGGADTEDTCGSDPECDLVGVVLRRGATTVTGVVGGGSGDDLSQLTDEATQIATGALEFLESHGQ